MSLGSPPLEAHYGVTFEEWFDANGYASCDSNINIHYMRRMWKEGRPYPARDHYPQYQPGGSYYDETHD